MKRWRKVGEEECSRFPILDDRTSWRPRFFLLLRFWCFFLPVPQIHWQSGRCSQQWKQRVGTLTFLTTQQVRWQIVNVRSALLVPIVVVLDKV